MSPTSALAEQGSGTAACGLDNLKTEGIRARKRSAKWQSAALCRMVTGGAVCRGNGEILSSPPRHPGRSYRVTNSRPRRHTRPPGSEKNEWTREVPPSEGNEVRRDGRQEVVALW